MKYINKIFFTFIIYSLCACGTKLTKAFESDFDTFYHKRDSLGLKRRDMLGFRLESFSYSVLEFKNKKAMRVNIWYQNEPYDSLLKKINAFHEELELKMPYIRNFKYFVYSVYSYSPPKRGSHYVTKTHIKVLKTPGATYFEYDPKIFNSENRYFLIRDSINNKR